MKSLVIHLMGKGSDKWREWISENNVAYERFEPNTICDAIRLCGVSHFPKNKPEYVDYKDAE